MKYLKTLLAIFIAITFSSYDVTAQAWLRPKGGSYSQLAFSSVTGSSKYSNAGDPLDLVRKVSDQTVQLYHEHGVSEKFTIVGSIPIKLVSTGDEIVSDGFSGNMLPSGNLTGLGNISLSAIYGLKQNSPWVYSVQLRADLPTASEDNLVGLRTGFDALGIAPSFHAGHKSKSFWASFDLGTNLRTNNYSTQWFSNVQIGTELSKAIILIVQFGALQSLEDGKALDGNAIETGLYTNDLEFAAYSLKVGYKLSEEMTVLGTIGGGVSGNDVTRAPAFSLSISYKRDKKSEGRTN